MIEWGNWEVDPLEEGSIWRYLIERVKGYRRWKNENQLWCEIGDKEGGEKNKCLLAKENIGNLLEKLNFIGKVKGANMSIRNELEWRNNYG